ncbi:MAG: dihydrodipicolinate synthase family protein [Acetobacteraceae bacterium]|nr:dihydrodipicolinate synthase family protein [Acetobacteraceae bacterium]
MTDLPIKGVFCAAATPLRPDLSPDLGVFVEHCRTLLDEGCDGIALLGTTGEANSFSTAERKSLLEAAVKGGVAPEKLIPGTGVAAFTETAELTQHALSLGVDTVVMLPPYYYKSVPEEGVFAAYAAIVERVADPRLRVILYHIPQFSAVPIAHDMIERLRKEFPGTFIGLKDSSGDYANMQALVKRFPGFSVLAGADPLMLKLLKEGGAGCITSACNLAAADLAVVFRHYADPSREAEVQAAQERVVAMRNRVSQFAQIPSVKALLRQKTGHPSWGAMRPPLLPLTPEEIERL